jgi:hypothetical protein
MGESGDRPGLRAERHAGSRGIPSGEAYKVGDSAPYARIPRLFLRQTIDLGGEKQKVEAGINQFAGSQTADRLVITLGKFGLTDVFDTNKYAHDPRSDFMNWALVDTGTFDYAADAWGYTYGAASSGTRAAGRCAAASSICRSCQTAPSLIRASASFNGLARSSAATSCGASPARSRSPDSSAAAAWAASMTPSCSQI